MKALVLEQVTHAYDGVPVVEDVDLEVAPGELVCLVGPSGCGKTTTLRVAAGLEALQQGRVLIHDRLVARRGGPQVPPEQRGVGLVFQDFALFPHLTVAENVAFGLAGMGAAARRRRVAEMLDQVELSEYADEYPHILSGGQQQRVALVRALAPRPRLMLLDEPFSGLDARLREQVRDQALHILKGSGASTLMVTHDAEEAMFMADRIAVMNLGRIMQVGRPVDIYYRPASAFVASFFSEVNRLGGVVRGGRVATPFGDLEAGGFADGSPVEVLIRPEAFRLASRVEGDSHPRGQVITSRLLGRTSLVHLRLAGVRGEDLHLHARVPGRFLPKEDEILAVRLDAHQAFVFPGSGTA